MPHLPPNAPQLSVVIPLLDEAESLPELVAWIEAVMQKHQFTYEIVLVDDGSTDTSWQVITGLAQKNTAVRGIKFRRNYGKSAALNEAFATVTGQVVITMDADLQDSPDEIPELFRMIVEENYDIVSGWKKTRYDPLSKTIPTKIYNWTTRLITGVKLHDMNCGLKAYKNEVVKNIEVFGEMHRYIPAMAKWQGFNRITEKIVQHRARKYGRSKFGLDRFIKGFLDLLTISFIGKFGKRPMHLFGTLGLVVFFIGFLLAGYLSFEKLILSQYGIAGRPMFFLAILCMIIGTQLFLTGFIGELIVRSSPHRNSYQIEALTEPHQTIN
ncbi:MAG: glycosyltransferase family 2 protein [Sphingobacteriales bacterium]|jgi:glycosyltransferase involved in cell wall biosynthesis|nr:glycosyltransferase family 2 protein [Sphingobacteriales bacterium]MBP9141089.1 glycosyltransferase family 2 protein [Chitinophagales bacterium]MDA0199591.1 glycosyltransferase family 2 protein [Bacteroidota bacterium]MBK6890953.1 glycosyltransferase family 2 protein [Sphingobacteriales bacterium]MBK7525998.1 glycosyltransferase family 2 protein [Sphingobacteriales bacterium]